MALAADLNPGFPHFPVRSGKLQESPLYILEPFRT